MVPDSRWNYIQAQREKQRWNAFIFSGANNTQSFAEYSAARAQKEIESHQTRKSS